MRSLFPSHTWSLNLFHFPYDTNLPRSHQLKDIWPSAPARPCADRPSKSMFVFISGAVEEERNTIHWPKAAVPGDRSGNAKQLEQARFLNPIIELIAFSQQSITSCITEAAISPNRCCVAGVFSCF